MDRILICRGGALGDLLQTFPVLERMRGAYPDAHIVLMANLPQARLAAVGGLTDEVVSLDRADLAEWFAPDAALPSGLAAFFLSFDLILSFLYDPAEGLAGKLRAIGVRRLVVCSPLVTAGHAIDHFASVLSALGLPAVPGAGVRLRLPESLMRRGADRVRSLGNHAIGIHPGSGSPRKNWPLERFVQVARLVEQRGVLRPLFLLGEAEGGMDAQLSRLCPGLSCLKGAELLELAGTLSHCRGYVGNDSGVTHLAAALGVPVVAIFGPTDPAVWAPRGAQVRVVRAEVVTPAEVADLLEMEPN